jgi:hypothetical protein
MAKVTKDEQQLKCLPREIKSEVQTLQYMYIQFYMCSSYTAWIHRATSYVQVRKKELLCWWIRIVPQQIQLNIFLDSLVSTE